MTMSRMLACERKFEEEAAEAEARLKAADHAWQGRVEEIEQAWGEMGEAGQKFG